MYDQGRRLFGMAMLVLGLAACESEEVFMAELNGANEVPPRTTNATGTATFTLIDATTLTYDVSVADIDSATAAHIHVGTADTTGGVIRDLFTQQPATALDFTGSLASGAITGVNEGIDMSFDSLLTRMRNGSLYVNVHSKTFPGGEIRGQIVVQQ